MPNYEMKFSVSEVARLLNVDRYIVKKWSFHFRDYLKPLANPPKGIPRQFCSDDLRVFAYVSTYWEDNPDIESIACGLNSGDTFEEPYNNFIALVTPLFVELPEEINEDWRHGAVIEGWADFGDTFALGDSFKLAADTLVEAAIANDEAYDLICPIIYNYRHAIELYLKAILPSERLHHNLFELLREFRELVKAKFNESLPAWFEKVVLSFNDFDPNGETFRYGNFTSFSKFGEVWVDIVHMKTEVGRLTDSLQNVRRRRGTI